ncbi:hypothetical protein [Phyllobacterium myrsinacearum]|uniref:Uncharacterized protein n=1 Tax=Phyllobacterium myrsinacearum TaxID=28101 RepID=A0A839EJT0_9HYPH|nr:hypothetical protein [Phyllobacterium myrsinacearum]MBA8878515.1 hypothetical protein [Phyllobacterium myrsinacearum]
MPVFLMILLAIHILSSIFWAGSTFTLARMGGAGSQQFFRPQMGAAAVAFLSGAALMGLYHGSWLSGSETVLGIGVFAAIAAAGVQGALRRKPDVSHRIAAGLLAITAVCMVIARFFA